MAALEAGATLELRGTDVTGGHPYAAVWLAEPGTYLLEDGAFEGGEGVTLGGRLTVHGNAVYARGATLTMAGSTVSGAADAGVLLDGSVATFAGNTFEGNGVDVVQQRCERLSPVTVEGASAEVCTGEDRLVDELEFSSYLREAGVE